MAQPSVHQVYMHTESAQYIGPELLCGKSYTGPHLPSFGKEGAEVITHVFSVFWLTPFHDTGSW